MRDSPPAASSPPGWRSDRAPRCQAVSPLRQDPFWARIEEQARVPRQPVTAPSHLWAGRASGAMSTQPGSHETSTPKPSRCSLGPVPRRLPRTSVGRFRRIKTLDASCAMPQADPLQRPLTCCRMESGASHATARPAAGSRRTRPSSGGPWIRASRKSLSACSRSTTGRPAPRHVPHATLDLRVAMSTTT
jgi:hypothetical protein